MSTFSIVSLEQDEAFLRALVLKTEGVEGAAYVLFREALIAEDPWMRRTHTKLLVREIVPIVPVSADAVHVTWNTTTFVELLQRTKRDGLILGIAHSHPQGVCDFSSQDDENEQELLRTACIRNGAATKLVSMLFTPDGKVRARVWQYPTYQTAAAPITVIGERIRVQQPESSSSMSSVFARQILAFGPTLTEQLRQLRVGIVGAGGTGSATAQLLARCGVGQLAVIDEDIVETTNLNRLHGASQIDADAMRAKADVVTTSIAEMALGTRAIPFRGWVNKPAIRDVLKACDVIFCCTDDHAGRVFLNRLAYFYLIPVLDMGLAMAVAKPPATGMADISARVTTLMPPEACLICRGAIDLEIAREEDLRRQQPAEYERRKREAYVRGEGNPNPAVVTFTTEVACMAVNELLNRFAGFRKKNMGFEVRRRFLFCEDRATATAPRVACTICGNREWWGMGDVEPFLDIVE